MRGTNLWLLTSIIISFSVFTSNFSLADTISSSKKTGSSKSKLNSKQLKNKVAPISISTSVTTTTNTYESSSALYSGRTTVAVSPAYNFKNGMTLGASISASQFHTGQQQSEWNNSSIFLSFAPFKINRNLSWSNRLSGTLPTNYKTQRDFSYQGGISGSTTLSQKTKIFKIPLGLSYTLGATRNFHEFTRSAFDSANIVQAGFATLGASKSWLKSRLRFSLSGGMSLSETYQGTQFTNFSLGQAISYVLLPKTRTTLTVGHTNAADVLKPDGKGSNVAFFDERSSTVYGSLGHSF